MAGPGKKGNSGRLAGAKAVVPIGGQKKSDDSLQLKGFAATPAVGNAITPQICELPTTGASAIRGSSPTSAETQGSEEPITPRVASDQSRGCGSNNLISTPDNTSIKNNAASTSNRKRGPTRNIGLAKKKQAGEKLPIIVSRGTGRVVGDGAQQFITEATCVLRRYATWQVKKWADIEETEREKLQKMIEQKGITHDGTSYAKKAIHKQLISQYRNRRYNFHRHFLKFRTMEEAIQHPPSTIKSLADWAWLCEYFSSEDFKKMSERNKKNRAEQNTAHTGGTKSFERHKFDKECKEGRKVGPIELYNIVHYSQKKQGMITEQTAAKLEKMKALQEESAANGSGKAEEDIVIEVDGHLPGHIRSRGAGQKPGLSREQIAEIEEAKKRAHEAETQAAELKAELIAQKEKMEKLTQQMDASQRSQEATNEMVLALLAKLEKQPHLVTNSTNLCVGWLLNLHRLRPIDLTLVDLSKATDWLETVTGLPQLEQVHMVWCGLPEILPTSVLSSINSSASLSTLDLRTNFLSSASIYPWLFNFSSSLVVVDLSQSSLQGPIPDSFCEMTSLSHLTIYFSNLEGGIPRCFGNFTNLESLGLVGNNLAGQLAEVMMNLSGMVHNTLKYLKLSLNNFSGSLPEISEFSSLTEFRLKSNELNGSLPKGYGQLPNLTILDVSGNQLSGTVPDFASSSALKELHLGNNQLSGYLTDSIGFLSSLEVLNLGSNQLEGAITETHLSKASQLQVLDLSFNSLLSLKFKSDWIPPFQLDTIAVADLSLGPHFPKWFQSQHNISKIDISSTGIADTIPNWFWDLSPRLTYLNVSNNKIYGILPDLSSKSSWPLRMDLSSNRFYGPIPFLPPNLWTLDLSRNFFWGAISFLCNVTSSPMRYLDLSNNILSGQIPDCLMRFESLRILSLANNRFIGTIPHSIGSLVYIAALHLRNNNFTGKIPRSLSNCRDLQILDLGENRISGKLPAWLGDSFSNLEVLSLQSNEFDGTIPPKLCHLRNIQILDLSNNKMFGSIPNCLDNLTAMAQLGSSKKTLTIDVLYYVDDRHEAGGVFHDESASVMWKEKIFEYRNTLGLLKVIDLSSNNLTGEISLEITSLLGLLGLNLSRNKLTGHIPENVGQVSLLNFLDLSRNHLFGSIPPSLSQLSHLGVLDLSYNNLSGKIPMTTQLQTFNASSYTGNSGLCGLPLPKACSEDTMTQQPNVTPSINRDEDEEPEDAFKTSGFFISVGIGFVFGLWGVFASLLISRSWRYAIFRCVNNIEDWLYVTEAIQKARLHRTCEKWRLRLKW